MQRGFVRKRGSSWTAYYYVTTARGRRQHSKGGFRTKGEAQAYLTRTLADLQRGVFVESTKLTVGEYLLDRWLPIMEHTIRPSTWDSYKRMIERHVIPAFGHKALQTLTADDLDALYARLLRSGSIRAGRGLSPKTVRYLHNTLHKALRDAERKQLVLRNVAAAADPPKARQVGGREMQTWTAEQLRAFLEATVDHRMYPAFVLAATTGMRRGEVLGVRWADIGFAARRLAVRQTVLSVSYQLSFGSPKTARGRRVLALDSATVAVLQQHRERQQQERALLESGYHDHGLVFARLDGRPIHPDYFTQAFDRAVAKLDLPRIRLHDLRHTHATLGLAAGVPPRVMADRLGHATVAFTQDIYMHAIPRLEEQAADQVAELIFGMAAEM
jgi:integrase